MAAILFTPTNQFPLKISSKIESLSLLERCSTMEELKQIHAQMIKTGLILKTIPVSRLLASCATSNYGSLTYAIRLFKAIPRPNTFMWNTVIRAHSKSNNPEDAILLYCQMLHSSKSALSYNIYTFPFLLKACSARSSVEEAKQIHAHIIKIGLDSDVYTANSLLHVYAKSGNLASARMLFDRILHRDIVTWNSMIDGYGKTGIVEAARELFDQMPAKNIISWTSMITACTEGGMFQEALTLFQEMLSVGIEPDGAALVGVISACTQLGALDEGKWISTYIERNNVQVDPILGCSLVDMLTAINKKMVALNCLFATNNGIVSATLTIMNRVQQDLC
ncbi:Pentatricopeptide repeat-containing protein [Acorus calamus]|uniref:Pentatricopeptide repeat-containing protein n=1 Tax=Acorus calamus TaxID=4465 RepID=A0AAV9DN58_ACOCL|nr:Pentatricopeptide repeat-containing protein [Acorus calamus]